jgi:hypothetical protein
VNAPAGEYPSDSIVEQVAVGGRYAAAVAEIGDGTFVACTKYTQPNCPLPTWQLTIVDVGTRRRAVVALPPETTSLALSGAGAAWLAPHASGGQALTAGVLTSHAGGLMISPRQIATGTITRVKLSGDTLSWSDAGRAHTATLRRASLRSGACPSFQRKPSPRAAGVICICCFWRRCAGSRAYSPNPRGRWESRSMKTSAGVGSGLGRAPCLGSSVCATAQAVCAGNLATRAGLCARVQGSSADPGHAETERHLTSGRCAPRRPRARRSSRG